VLKLKLNHVCVKSLCEGEPKLDHIVRILSPSADDQMCITAQELLQNRLLIERLDKLGHCKEAFLLKTLGDDYQAWDCPGLSRAEREYRHKGERKALTALLGERLNLVKGLTVSHFEGFSRQLIMEELTNIDAHEQYLLHVPGLGDVMVDRFYSTDDIEGEFSVLVLGCGFKPTAEVALGFMRNQDLLVRMKQDPNLGFKFPYSTKSSYPHHEYANRWESKWADVTLLEQEGPAKEKYHTNMTKRATRNTTPIQTIRQVHKASAMKM
jgi:hypothetical protein